MTIDITLFIDTNGYIDIHNYLKEHGYVKHDEVLGVRLDSIAASRILKVTPRTYNNYVKASLIKVGGDGRIRLDELLEIDIKTLRTTKSLMNGYSDRRQRRKKT